MCLQLPQQALQWEGRQRWRPMLGNLRQMLLADSLVEQRANWHIGGSLSSTVGAKRSDNLGIAGAADSGSREDAINRSCASMVFLRGDLSADELSSVLRSPIHFRSHNCLRRQISKAYGSMQYNYTFFVGQDDMCGRSPSPRGKTGGAAGTGAAVAPVMDPGPVEEARRAFEMAVRTGN